VKPADQNPTSSKDESIAGLVDIAPTLAGLAGLHVDSHAFQGRHLFSPKAKGEEDSRIGYAESLYPLSSFGWHSLHSVQNQRYHYIEAGHPELYDLSQDPGELRNIFDEKPSVAAVLKQELHSVLSRYQLNAKKTSPPGLDSESSRQLQALGYIGSSPESVPIGDPSRVPDPKDKVDVFNEILRATELTQDGRFQESGAALQRLVDRNPEMSLLPYLQAENLFSSGASKEAMPYYRHALELNPRYSLAAIGLGHAAYRAGDDSEAETAYRSALSLNPRNSLVRLALAKSYLRLKRLTDAAREQRTVLLADPNIPNAYEDYAGTLILMNQFSEAVPILQKAVASSDVTPDTFSLLGSAYVHTGRFAEAIAVYKKAIDLNSDYAPAYFSLALIYYKLQDQENFRSNYEKGCRLDAQMCQTLDSRIH
jgi:tetratricopeptide (TPR) repeat protein